MNNSTYLTISYQNEPGWHTYWKNPGHAGIPLKNIFSINNTPIELVELEWPTPIRIEESNVISYGYVGTYSLYYKIPEDIKESISLNQLQIVSQFLACKNICVPETQTTFGVFKNDFIQAGKPKFLRTAQDLKDGMQNIPEKKPFPEQLKISLSKAADNKLALFYEYKGSTIYFDNSLTNLLTPFPQPLLSFEKEILFTDNNFKLFGIQDVDWNGLYQEPELALPENGKFDIPQTVTFLFCDPVTKKTFIIEKTFDSFSTTDFTKKSNLLKTLFPSQKEATQNIKTEQKATSFSLLLYILFALLGGVILNFMPCVLPIISLKLFSLIKHKEYSKKELFKHNIYYSAGIISSFLALGSVVYFLKKSGEVVGWGFQLQSNLFVGLMIIILFIFALNLFGLFEFKTPFGKILGNYNLKESYLGDFFNGIIATILSTPCSAPFLGTALAFAFTVGDEAIFIIFVSIGIGLSLPFILTAIFPKTISFLPKPGRWMEHLKKILGITLLVTAIWLINIFNILTNNPDTIFYFHLLLTLIFFSLFFVKFISNKKIWAITFTLLSVIASIAYFDYVYKLDSSINISQDNVNLPSEKWTPEKLFNSNRTIFMDFTAQWCLTCKVNEKLIFTTNRFKQLMEKHNVLFLVADWTHKDPIIGNWLKKHNVVGVPAYFIQDKNGKLYFLGELTTSEEVEQILIKIQTEN